MSLFGTRHQQLRSAGHLPALDGATGWLNSEPLDPAERRPAATRQAFADELLSTADDIAARLDGTDTEAARTDALRPGTHDWRYWRRGLRETVADILPVMST